MGLVGAWWNFNDTKLKQRQTIFVHYNTEGYFPLRFWISSMRQLLVRFPFFLIKRNKRSHFQRIECLQKSGGKFCIQILKTWKKGMDRMPPGQILLPTCNKTKCFSTDRFICCQTSVWWPALWRHAFSEMRHTTEWA